MLTVIKGGIRTLNEEISHRAGPVKRDWAMAKGWLKGQLSGASDMQQATEP